MKSTVPPTSGWRHNGCALEGDAITIAIQRDGATDDLTPLWVAVGLSMAPAATLGLGRFAYALLLPAMRADLGWSYADAGLMNTSNALGYLAGALAASSVVRRFGLKSALVAGVVISAALLAISGATRDFTLLLALRFLAGVAGAASFVAGAALTAAASGSARRASLALGMYFAGPGLGVILSALAIPPLLSRYGWGVSWIVLGGLSLVALAAAVPALMRAPQPKGAPPGMRSGAWPRDRVFALLASYGIYGAGYISYMTFIIAFLRRDLGFGDAEIAGFWLVLGTGSVVGAYGWGLVLPRLPGARGAALITAILAVASILPLVSATHSGAYLSAATFGCVFLSVVTAVTGFVRQVAAPHAWAAAIGLFTVMFALGQCVGPVLTGLVADGPQGIRAGLWLSGAILALATAAALLQRDLKTAEATR